MRRVPPGDMCRLFTQTRIAEALSAARTRCRARCRSVHTSLTGCACAFSLACFLRYSSVSFSLILPSLPLADIFAAARLGGMRLHGCRDVLWRLYARTRAGENSALLFREKRACTCRYRCLFGNMPARRKWRVLERATSRTFAFCMARKRVARRVVKHSGRREKPWRLLSAAAGASSAELGSIPR